jgi:hypothetical protein
MGNSMYDQVVPPLSRMLSGLDKILSKAESDATNRKIEPQTLLSARLAPDMLPLTRQVQMMTDHAKFAACRLTGSEAPKWADDETSFADLHQRIGKALDLLKTFTPAQFDGADSRPVELKLPSGALTFSGRDYFDGFLLPNFYFHYTTAYNILRHNGLQIGKLDFLNPGVPDGRAAGTLIRRKAEAGASAHIGAAAPELSALHT